MVSYEIFWSAQGPWIWVLGLWSLVPRLDNTPTRSGSALGQRAGKKIMRPPLIFSRYRISNDKTILLLLTLILILLTDGSFQICIFNYLKIAEIYLKIIHICLNYVSYIILTFIYIMLFKMSFTN